MKWICCVILMLSMGPGCKESNRTSPTVLKDEQVVLNEAFIVLKFGTMELEDKDGTKRKVAVESEDSPTKVIRLTGGETLRTEIDSNCQVVFPEAGAIQLHGESGIKIPASAPEGEQKEKMPTSIEFLGGKLFLDIDAEKLLKDKKEFRVKTPTTILAVKGTRFYVETGKESETIGVHEGRVLMIETQSGNQVIINSKQLATAKPGAITQPRAMMEEELTLATPYESLASEFVPAEGLERKYTTEFAVDGLPGPKGRPPGLIEVDKGKDYGGRASLEIKFRTYAEDPDRPAFASTTVEITEEPESQPRAAYFSMRSQDVRGFVVNCGVEWKGRYFVTEPISQILSFPADTKPEQWVSFMLPLNETTMTPPSLGFRVTNYPHYEYEPGTSDSVGVAKKGKPEYTMELSAIMFGVDQEK